MNAISMSFKCPYNNKTCIKLDVIFATELSPCINCKHYEKKIGLLDKIKMEIAEWMIKISTN